MGKTTAARLLFRSLPNAAWLDGDDVWRIRPFEVNDATRSLVERNIPFVLRGYLEAGYETVVLSWVLHRQSLVDRLVAALEGIPFQLRVFTLLAEIGVIRDRLTNDRNRDVAPLRVEEILETSAGLRSEKIDTTSRNPEEIVAHIQRRLAEATAV